MYSITMNVPVRLSDFVNFADEWMIERRR